MDFLETALTGVDLINQPMLNKGTALPKKNVTRLRCTACCRLTSETWPIKSRGA